MPVGHNDIVRDKEAGADPIKVRVPGHFDPSDSGDIRLDRQPTILKDLPSRCYAQEMSTLDKQGRSAEKQDDCLKARDLIRREICRMFVPLNLIDCPKGSTGNLIIRMGDIRK